MKEIAFLFPFLILGCNSVDIEPPNFILTPATKIIETQGIDNFCSVSADGKYIAFSSNKNGNFDIYIKNVNEKVITQITFGKENEICPVFSPDGNRIAFSSNKLGSFDIFIINTKGRGIQQITFDKEKNEIFPDFSPDGRKILFTSLSEKGDPSILMIADLENGFLTEITNGFYGRFSKDGKEILFERNNGEIWIVGIDGRNERLIFKNENFSCMFPNFSQDGKKIVYTSWPKDWRKKSKGILRFDTKIEGIKDARMVNIRVVNIDGTGDMQLTGGGLDGFPVWSNDGFIYFSSLRENNVDIFRVSAPEEKIVHSPQSIVHIGEEKGEEKVNKKEETKARRIFPKPKEKEPKTRVITIRDNVNIWSYPGKSIIASLNKGVQLIVIDSSKKWYIKVLLPDGRTGWVSSFFVE